MFSHQIVRIHLDPPNRTEPRTNLRRRYVSWYYGFYKQIVGIKPNKEVIPADDFFV